jgi:UPF0716 protein FxsA
MFVRLLLLFTVVPLVELVLLVEIGRLIGTIPTIGIVIGTGILGAWLTKLEGLRTLHGIREDLQQGRMPADRLIDGLLILVAGAVLLTPGLLTDALGFFLLVPPGRKLVRVALARAFKARFRIETPQVIDPEWSREDEVIDAEWSREDDPPKGRTTQ